MFSTFVRLVLRLEYLAKFISVDIAEYERYNITSSSNLSNISMYRYIAVMTQIHTLLLFIEWATDRKTWFLAYSTWRS